MIERIVATLLVLLLAIPCFAEDDALKQVSTLNPHTLKGNCDICHSASEKDLNSWFTFSSTKRLMKKDLNMTCQQCHGVEFGHGIGKWTNLNRDNLPMDANGYIACAITCHDMHVKTTDQHQNKFHLRVPSNKLCLSCHDQ